MQELAFRAVQVFLWSLLIAGWIRTCRSRPNLNRSRPNSQPLRSWFSGASLACASLSLLFTTAMTIYARTAQQKPYDAWESLYLLSTTGLSVFGITLGAIGRAAPRLIGLCTSVVTLLIALLDAVSL